MREVLDTTCDRLVSSECIIQQTITDRDQYGNLAQSEKTQMRRLASTLPAQRASVKLCYFQVVFTISICISKNSVISVSDVFFPQLSNGVGGFSEIFDFHPQNV